MCLGELPEVKKETIDVLLAEGLNRFYFDETLKKIIQENKKLCDFLDICSKRYPDPNVFMTGALTLYVLLDTQIKNNTLEEELGDCSQE